MHSHSPLRDNGAVHPVQRQGLASLRCRVPVNAFMDGRAKFVDPRAGDQHRGAAPSTRDERSGFLHPPPQEGGCGKRTR
eukprot:621735-Alexandrium_andersonii.AAC.2